MSGLEGFYREGRTAYREAKTATRAFELEMQNRLKACIARRTKWGPFDRGRTTPAVGGDDTSGFWVSLNLKGHVDRDEAVVEVGYWWLPSSHQLGTGAVIYATFYEGPERLLGFKIDESGAGILSFKWEGRTHIALPMPEDMDPGPALDRLLDCLVRAM